LTKVSSYKSSKTAIIEGRNLMYKLFLSFVICTPLISASIVNGQEQDWAKAMFSETSHDFGVVARGAKVEYKIIITNIYEEDVQITSVLSSCSCTSAKVNKKFLKTWEKAELTIMIDTKQFLGRKDATITVKFDKPFSAEVQIHSHTYIRSDVVVQPGVIQFGSVAQGTVAKQKVSVTYAGRDDWRIERIESANPYLSGEIAEVSRGGGQVKYDLSVTLGANATAGYIQDQIILLTNDINQRSSRVPVAVEGVVSPSLSVRPTPLFMGVIEAGQTISKPLVIQGKAPFHITSATSSDPRFKCKIPEDSKSVQLLPVSFDTTNTSGKITAKIKIETDYPNTKPLEVDVNVQVTPKTSASE
jgi:hypothetical protein